MYKVLEIIMYCLISIIMLKYALVENAMAADPHSCTAIVSSPESKNPDDVINCIIVEGTPVRSIVEAIVAKSFKKNRMETARHISTVRELSQQADKSKTTVRNKEKIRLQQSVKDPYRWRCLATVIIEVLAGCYFLFRKS